MPLCLYISCPFASTSHAPLPVHLMLFCLYISCPFASTSHAPLPEHIMPLCLYISCPFACTLMSLCLYTLCPFAYTSHAPLPIHLMPLPCPHLAVMPSQTAYKFNRLSSFLMESFICNGPNLLRRKDKTMNWTPLLDFLRPPKYIL